MPRFLPILRLLVLAALALPFAAQAEEVTFAAADGLVVTADLEGPADGPLILLFHMAGSSRGEYRGIAPRLNALGYRTLAVDQRSGGAFDGVPNETARRAGRDPGYLAASADLLAAVAFARERLGARRIAVVGSSYSASLVLVLAGRDPGFAEAVMAFSPGEYFADPALVRDAARAVRVPVFLASARGERSETEAIAAVLPLHPLPFVPKGRGAHGASALAGPDGAEYWAALEGFLAERFPAK